MPEKSVLADQRSGTYNAIVATYKLMFRRMTEMLLKEGLTQPQFQALRVIAKFGPTPMKTISDKMSVTAANVTGIVDRLESKGLVLRHARRDDRRATMISLTPKGKRIQEGVSGKTAKFVQEALGEFTPEEQDTLGRLLAKLQAEMSRSDSRAARDRT
ncbi:MAG: MarR family transcriptional regulator [Thaumarchaeota archaeon]|nr:MarR family transcriptional regulator [Nitrososphaerota archaeon]